MRVRVALLIVLSCIGFVACSARDEREWMAMKVDRRHTKQEFQQDYKDCSRKGDVDEPCMRQRGWVPVNPTKDEAPKSMDPLQQQQRGRGRY